MHYISPVDLFSISWFLVILFGGGAGSGVTGSWMVDAVEKVPWERKSCVDFLAGFAVYSFEVESSMGSTVLPADYWVRIRET